MWSNSCTPGATYQTESHFINPDRGKENVQGSGPLLLQLYGDTFESYNEDARGFKIN